MQRPRSAANNNVTVKEYAIALREFRGAKTWFQIFGTSFVRDARHVKPIDIVTLQPLFLALMEAGLKNCMVTPKKIEQAFRIASAEKPPSGFTLESYPLALADHVRVCFNFVRTLIVEDAADKLPNAAANRTRRYPKTNPFRKACTSTDSILITALKRHSVFRNDEMNDDDDAPTESLFRTGTLSSVMLGSPPLSVTSAPAASPAASVTSAPAASLTSAPANIFRNTMQLLTEFVPMPTHVGTMVEFTPMPSPHSSAQASPQPSPMPPASHGRGYLIDQASSGETHTDSSGLYGEEGDVAPVSPQFPALQDAECQDGDGDEGSDEDDLAAPKTVMYDEDGILVGTLMRECPAAVEPHPTIRGAIAKKRQNNRGGSSCQPKKMPRKENKGSSKRKAKKTKVSEDVPKKRAPNGSLLAMDEAALCSNARASTTATPEDNPRCELVANILGKRRHIFTLRLKAHGPNFSKVAQAVKAEVDNGKMTKETCLAMKDRLLRLSMRDPNFAF